MLAGRVSLVLAGIGLYLLLPALILSGLMLGALGMLISSGIKQLENFAGVMNFVIFPMFFASSALYPLWRIRERILQALDQCSIYEMATDTHVVRNGKIVAQSFAGQIKPKP